MQEIKFKGNEAFRAVAQMSRIFESLEADKHYTLTLKEYRPRRSLEANGYFWILVDKLAERVHESKEDIYKGYIKQIGGNNYMMTLEDRAVEGLCKHWQSKGIGWVTDVLPNMKYPKCKNVILYYGSSEYDTEQMSRLIDLAVQDCKALGIETLDDIKLNALIEEWGEKS